MARRGLGSFCLGAAATALIAAQVFNHRTDGEQAFLAPRGFSSYQQHTAKSGGSKLSPLGGSPAILAAMATCTACTHLRIRCRAKDKESSKKSEKALTDEVAEDLDRKMLECAEANDFAGAARLRDELCSSQLDDEGHVLQCNTEFYAAFTARDFERMKACWLPSSTAQCVHPYDKTVSVLQGFTEISDSFHRIFEESKTKSRILPEEVKVSLRGATAVVTCQEKVVNKGHLQTMLLSTHVFRRGPNDKWLLMHRHASKPPGEPMVIDEGGAWNARLQQLMRAAQTLNPGNPQFIINAATPVYDEEDSPFGIAESLEPADEEEMSSEDDEPDEIYVEEEDDIMEDARDAWRALRRLARNGTITRAEKVQLLADLIENPTESVPAKAHRLLLRGVEEDEESEAWEDFEDLIKFQVKKAGV